MIVPRLGYDGFVSVPRPGQIGTCKIGWPHEFGNGTSQGSNACKMLPPGTRGWMTSK